MLTFNIWNIVFTVINLIVLYLILKRVLIKPVMNIMEARKTLIQNQLDEARKTEKAANQLKTEYQQSMDSVREQSEKIVADARQKGKEEFSRIVGNAEIEAGEILKKSRSNAETERKRMMKDVEDEIARLAIAAAGKIIAAQPEEEKNQALYDAFLAKEEAGDGHDSKDC